MRAGTEGPLPFRASSYFNDNGFLGEVAKKALCGNAARAAIVWAVWKERNKRIFLEKNAEIGKSGGIG